MRVITATELRSTLKSHKDWVDSNGKKGYRADLVKTILIGVDLRGVDLRRANLSGANLSWTNLTETDLRGANLRNADLSDTEVRGVDLSKVDLRDAHLRGADLRDTNLRKAVLTGADLREADLRGADLSDSILSGTNLNDTKFFYTDHSGTNRIKEDFSVALLGQTRLREEEQLNAKIEKEEIEIEKRELEIARLKSEVIKKNSEKVTEYGMSASNKEKEALARISQAEELGRYVWKIKEQKDDITSRSLRVNYNKTVLLLREWWPLTKKKVNKTLEMVLALNMQKIIQIYQSIFGEADNFCQEDTFWQTGQTINYQLSDFDKYGSNSSFCSRQYFNSIHTTLPP